MWERWDAVLADGTLHKGEMQSDEGATMTSFNHYAYGCVAAWLYHTVAGIAPDASRPGFAHVIFSPRPGGELSHAAASIATAFGRSAVTWTLTGDAMRVSVELPPGSTGEFHAPADYEISFGARTNGLGSGKHHFTLRRTGS